MGSMTYLILYPSEEQSDKFCRLKLSNRLHLQFDIW